MSPVSHVKPPPTTNKVAVFIDNSNVFRSLRDLKMDDPAWVCFYNPLILAQKLAGARELVYVGFYCVRPPAYLLEEGKAGIKKHGTTLQYYMVTVAALGKFDAAILVSNDGDYVSAVENVKNSFLKRVEVLFLRGKLSMALRQACDLTRRARRSPFEKLSF